MAKTDSKANKVVNDFQAAWEYTEGSWHDRWRDNYFLYNNQRIKVDYEGIANSFDPMTFSTVESLVSALFGTKPKIEYIPPAEKNEQNTETINALYDYYYDKDQWAVKNISWGRSMLSLGTGIAFYYWDSDCVRKSIIPLRDFFIDPTATSIEDARYVGRRYLTTKEELESYEVVNVETGEMEKRFKNLGNLGKSKTEENTDKEEKDMWYGSTVKEAKQKQIEVIEYWTDDEVISVANRSKVIEERENTFKAKARQMGEKYPKGFKPFASMRDYVDESLFYAKGEIDFIRELQEDLNDLSNQNKDAITYNLNQMYTLDPLYSDMINEIENIPGAVYPVEAGALQPIPMQPIPNDAFNERLNIKNQIRETTASNEIVKGVGVEGQVTATEINAQIAGSGQRIGLKVTQIENEGFYQEAKIVLAMIRLYVTETQLVRVTGRKTSYEEFNPEEFKDGDYQPRAQLDITVQAQKNEQANNAKEMYAAFLDDPDINQTELKRTVLMRGFDLDPDEVESLLQEPQEMLPPEIGQIPIDDTMPIEQQLPPELLNMEVGLDNGIGSF